MKIKVCGLKDKNQMLDLYISIDFIGINFYSSSTRFYNGEDLKNLDFGNTKKTGIFVNADSDYVYKMIEAHGLDYVQLHGDETPAYCTLIASKAKVIKAFQPHAISDTDLLNRYNMCELFLFDTASLNYGGSGKKFDWELLKDYKGKKPYLLAGGISEADAENIIKIKNYTGFLGIDLNSKFEKSPGIKDLTKIREFIKLIK